VTCLGVLEAEHTAFSVSSLCVYVCFNCTYFLSFIHLLAESFVMSCKTISSRCVEDVFVCLSLCGILAHARARSLSLSLWNSHLLLLLLSCSLSLSLSGVFIQCSYRCSPPICVAIDVGRHGAAVFTEFARCSR
jgi:hypothetical protein